jgi:multiple sugar transport system permease protein
MVVRNRLTKSVFYHLFALILAIVMIYPVLWMVSSSFKTQTSIFRSQLSLIPDEWVFENFSEGWRGFGQYTFTTFFKNSIIITALSTVGAVISSSFIAFGFARIRFAGNKLWFGVMIATLLLPFEIKMIPQYLLFHRLGWVNTFLPIIVPSCLGGSAFFIFLMVQFMRTVPYELDESAYMDGCGRFRIFWSIVLPLSKPALMTAAIFSFYWRWNDFIQPLLYLAKPKLYTVSVALRLFADPTSVTNWGAMFAVATVSLIPVILVFVFLQRHIVEGISSTGLKG